MLRRAVWLMLGACVAWAAPEDEAPSAGSAPPYDMAVVDEIDCENAPKWDEGLLGGLRDANVDVQHVRSDTWLGRAGFGRYVSVFGVPIIVSDNIGEVTLKQAGKTLASLLDSDGDGRADNPDFVGSLIRYRVVLGWFATGAESEAFWKNAEKREDYHPFMEQYLCNMHFVEIWRTDLSTLYYTSMAERDEKIEAGQLEPDSPNILKRCGGATTENFDLSLWYYMFALYYYGIVDTLSPEQTVVVQKHMQNSMSDKDFTPQYSADPEMTLADYLAWANLTQMGAVVCHCTQSAVQQHWKACLPSDLPEPITELLLELPSIPSALPSNAYPQSILSHRQQAESGKDDEGDDDDDDNDDDDDDGEMDQDDDMSPMDDSPFEESRKEYSEVVASFAEA